MKRFNNIVLLVFCGFLLAQAQIQPLTTPRAHYANMPQAKLDAITNFTLPATYSDRKAHPLPASVDNSSQKFFPPFNWSESGDACVQAVSVSYMYTYELAYTQNISGALGGNPLCAYAYTFNFMNQVSGDGWMIVEDLDIMKAMGAPTTADYPWAGIGISSDAWMSGYDKYYRAMKYRLDDYYKVDMATAKGDTLVKQYLYDHADGSSVGGLVGIIVNCDKWKNGGSSTVAGATAFTSAELCCGGGHGLTVCGYNDSKAAWLVCGNWGEGFYWAPYSMFHSGSGWYQTGDCSGDPQYDNNHYFYMGKIKKNYTPYLTFKVTVTSAARNGIYISTGVAPTANATAPTQVGDYGEAFHDGGVAAPMCGKGQSSTIQIGLDLTSYAKYITGNDATFFLVAKGGTGTIDSISLMDYTGGSTPVEIKGAGKTISTTAVTIPISWHGTIPGTAVARAAAAAVTPQTKLSASPNPANKFSNAIQFKFPAGSSALMTLSIMDVSGHCVYKKTSALAEHAVGSAGESWNLTNASGRKVAPGAYIATVDLKDANGCIQTMSTKIVIKN